MSSVSRDRRKLKRPDSTDRRDDERQAVETTLWIAGDDVDDYEPLSVNDVSLSGLAFRSKIAWKEGDTVRIHVNVDRPLELAGRVSRCVSREAERGIAQLFSGTLYDVGIAFEEGDRDHCQVVVGQIQLSEVYHRGLYV
jgi:hypothetical protein